MKQVILFFIFGICTFFSYSQKAIDSTTSKISRTTIAVNNADAAVNGATTAVNNTAATAVNIKNTLSGLFPKKKQKAVANAAPVTSDVQATTNVTAVSSGASQVAAQKTNDVVSDENTTIITIAGIDYDKLKDLKTNIEACASVSKASLKFDADQSTITVNHKGSTDNLWGLMMQTCKTIISSKNLKKLDEGVITLKM